jgi:hypothetical protein
MGGGVLGAAVRWIKNNAALNAVLGQVISAMAAL